MTQPHLGSELCPCCSGLTYGACCRKFHRGERSAETALELMRSRYAAYALRDAPYVLATWAPQTRPPHLDLDDRGLRWCGLVILHTAQGTAADSEGLVSFRASFRQGPSRQHMQELSRFVRLNGQWFYLDGDAQAAP